MTAEPLSRKDRDDLIRVARMRARTATAEAKSRERVLLAEVENDLAATFSADDALWAEATNEARKALAAANDHIRRQCADLGIPADMAPSLMMGFASRGANSTPARRAELRKLAQSKLAAMTATVVAEIQAGAMRVEEALILGGLESAQARELFASLPTVEALMPPLSLDDLGVVRWQPPEDAVEQLTTPLTPADRRRRQIRRVIAANPALSNRKLAELAGCDAKTIAAYRREAVEIRAVSEEFPTQAEEFPTSALRVVNDAQTVTDAAT